MMTYEFDIQRVIGLKIVGPRETSYKWLPAKQKTCLFGLIKRNKWYSEGFYSYGHYTECYESGCWDATPVSVKSLESIGYLVDTSKKTVTAKPFVEIYLESEYKVTKSFNTIEEANNWSKALKEKTGKEFEIIQ
jgi:hypothetical protein